MTRQRSRGERQDLRHAYTKKKKLSRLVNGLQKVKTLKIDL
jgi:hypothetical protein